MILSIDGAIIGIGDHIDSQHCGEADDIFVQITESRQPSCLPELRWHSEDLPYHQRQLRLFCWVVKTVRAHFRKPKLAHPLEKIQ